MKRTTRPPAVLMLQDGTVFHGTAVGLIGTTGGEICFNTGMTGYQEIYTDPSYYGQIVVNTASHIGNYGATNDEQESDHPQISGMVVNSFSEIYSRDTATESLDEYLKRTQTVGIASVDVRKIVRHIRNKGAMNAIISSEVLDENVLKQQLNNVPSMEQLELSSKVTCKEPYYVGDSNAQYKVAVLDLGCKKSILKNFSIRGVFCKVFPAQTSLAEMEQWNPDGYFISNGPGDPAATAYATETVKAILEKDYPMFGICLGHQILAQACDIKTYKMHHGHRGLNHPVKNLKTGKCEVTSQNHGFSVELDGLENHRDVELTHINLNDKTVAGIKLKNKRAFSVQYHPEASPGPHDSRYLFDDFIALINQN